jgi:diguanylate cyclase (GGDEF)-like protein
MFNDRLNLALRRAQRDSSYGLAVLFIDSDSFKVINDSLGHHAGDLLLLEIAERLAHAVHSLDGVLRTAGPAQDGVGRPVPLAARLGGDEFGVLLDGIIDDGEAVAISQRLATELARPYTLNGQTVHNTVSIGITTSRSNAYAAAGEMLRDADTAMYRAKREGRCRVAVFDQRMHTEAMTRLTLEADLHAAVERDEIQLHYQPIIELRSRELTGFEALARWHHPQHGWIAPATFIPLAEETGVILPLGQRLLDSPFLLLAAGMIVMFVFFTGWGLVEIFSLKQAPLP